MGIAWIKCCNKGSKGRACWEFAFKQAVSGTEQIAHAQRANSHYFLLAVIPMSARSSALLDRQIWPSSKEAPNADYALSVRPISTETGQFLESFDRFSRSHP